ncbi:hypothetical protein INR49_002045 [Caranx melampygus]|nr:hypothetical protein INR49_002045 [Caranx melampygus]
MGGKTVKITLAETLEDLTKDNLRSSSTTSWIAGRSRGSDGAVLRVKITWVSPTCWCQHLPRPELPGWCGAPAGDRLQRGSSQTREGSATL